MKYSKKYTFINLSYPNITNHIIQRFVLKRQMIYKPLTNYKPKIVNNDNKNVYNISSMGLLHVIFY